MIIVTYLNFFPGVVKSRRYHCNKWLYHVSKKKKCILRDKAFRCYAYISMIIICPVVIIHTPHYIDVVWILHFICLALYHILCNCWCMFIWYFMMFSKFRSFSCYVADTILSYKYPCWHVFGSLALDILNLILNKEMIFKVL